MPYSGGEGKTALVSNGAVAERVNLDWGVSQVHPHLRGNIMAFKSTILGSLLLFPTVQLNTQPSTAASAMALRTSARHRYEPDSTTTLEVRDHGKFNRNSQSCFLRLGDVPTNVADQLGFGERQGADANRPASQGRVLVQWQLDKAEGVVPAQHLQFRNVNPPREFNDALNPEHSFLELSLQAVVSTAS